VTPAPDANTPPGPRPSQTQTLTPQVIWDGKLGDGWSMTKSVGVVTPPAPGPGNLTDLCVTFPAHGSLSFAYSARRPCHATTTIYRQAV